VKLSLTNAAIFLSLLSISLTLPATEAPNPTIYSDMYLGFEALKENRTNDALLFFTRAAESNDPKTSMLGRHRVIEILIQTKKLTQAREYASKNIENNNSIPDLIFLIENLSRIGDVANVVRAYDRLTLIGGAINDGFLEVILPFVKGDFKAYIQAYEKYIGKRGDLEISPPIIDFEAVYFLLCKELGHATKLKPFYPEKTLQEHNIQNWLVPPLNDNELSSYCVQFSDQMMDKKPRVNMFLMKYRILYILQNQASAHKAFFEASHNSNGVKRLADWINNFEITRAEWEKGWKNSDLLKKVNKKH
jgi:hypothetical protein